MNAPRTVDNDGMRAGDRPILPLWLRTGVLAMLLAGLMIALFANGEGQLEGIDRGDVAASRELRFIDEPSGRISVRDAADDTELVSLAVGEGGFIRSVMRGLARERHSQGIGQEIPFIVRRYTEGYVSLEDPATDTVVELTAFGPDNVESFIRLLPALDPA